MDTIGVLLGEVSASLAQAVALLSESETAATLSFLRGELVDLGVARRFGDTVDSHHAGLSAGDHLVGTDIGVVTGVVLGFAHGRAFVLALNFNNSGDTAAIETGSGTMDTIGVLLGEVSASLAQAVALLSESETAATLSFLRGELVDLGVARRFGDTVDSHHAGLSAGDHLVGTDIGVVTGVVLGLAISRALVLVSDDDNCRLGLNDNGVTTTVSRSLSSDLTATVSTSTVVASAGVVVLFLGMESLLSECSASDECHSGCSSTGGTDSGDSGVMSSLLGKSNSSAVGGKCGLSSSVGSRSSEVSGSFGECYSSVMGGKS